MVHVRLEVQPFSVDHLVTVDTANSDLLPAALASAPGATDHLVGHDGVAVGDESGAETRTALCALDRDRDCVRESGWSCSADSLPRLGKPQFGNPALDVVEVEIGP